MKKILFLFALAATYFPVFAQVTSNLDLIDLYDLEYISDPQISPDGSKIIYVRNFTDVMTDRNLSNLWIINSDGSNNRPLTTGNTNDYNPRWSHDGKKILFKSNQADDKMKLYLMWMDTREVMALTNTIRTPGTVAWSHDDQLVAFNMFVPKSDPSPIKLPAKPEGAQWNSPPIYIDAINYRHDGQGYAESGYSQLFVLSVNGGTPRQLTFEEFDHSGPVWSKNDQLLYFSANYHPDSELEGMDSEIYQISVSDGTSKALTSRYGPDQSPAVSPDGSKIAYTGFDDTYQGHQETQLYVMNADGSNVQWISGDFDRDIANIQWKADGKSIYFQYDEFGDTKIGEMTLTGKMIPVAQQLGGLSLGRPYNAADFTVSTTNSFAYTLGGTDHPSDLSVLIKGKAQRLTAVNDDLFAFKKLGNTEEIWWESAFDQRKIQGWIVTPPDFDPSKKYPLILEIHGGPFTSYGAEFSAEIQAYAARGYVVLYCNPRGSTSYGEEFANLIHHDYPHHDYDDLMSGVDAVLKKGYVDENNLFVTGGSGGGVLTAWIVGHTDRFKAAVVAKPVINWYSFILYSDGIQFFNKYWFEKLPWEDPTNYLERSPLTYAGHVTTPTMLLTGESDFRTPIAESEQFYAALKLEGVETAMVRIPGASHGITNRPSNLVAKIASVLYWFEKYRAQE